MGRYVLEGARERFTWTDKQYEKENDITGVAFDSSPLGKLADLMPQVDFDAVQNAVTR